MASNLPSPATKSSTTPSQEKRHRSIFEVPHNFFDSSLLLHSPHSLLSDHHFHDSHNVTLQTVEPSENDVVSGRRWTCNTCKAQFDSLQDQRSHFKSDIHRFNVKLTIAGKKIVKEEDFEVLTSELVKDYDVSSISGSDSDDDSENESQNQNRVRYKSGESLKQKLFVCLQTGQRVSVWKCLIMNMNESVLYDNEKEESKIVERLKSLTVEPRDNTRLRIVLLASGGHFAACVFDGDAVVAHKTFHRYVVRAKAGKKQSSKDASGRAAHSAGASLRRHNELALKKEVQELFAAWRHYFDASNCIFIHAPSSSRLLLYDGERSYFTNQQSAIRNIPLTVRRPTFREAKRVYSQLTQVSYEADEKETLQSNQEDIVSIPNTIRNSSPPLRKGNMDELDHKDKAETFSIKQNDKLPISIDGESENELCDKSTPLHQAAHSDDSEKVMELLEQGLDPCIKDERGRTPYMLAHEKEVRNAFRRFMASNPDKWDWHAAKVPSALTKEMEESQAAKQEVQELFAAWRHYFDASNCIFIHAPSSSRLLLYDGERSYFTNQQSAIRNIPLTVRRPTFREAKRVYSQLTQVSYEADEKETLQSNQEDIVSIPNTIRNSSPPLRKGNMDELDHKDKAETFSIKQNDKLPISIDGESENELCDKSTPLHQAAHSDDSEKVMELLEQGLDPCIKDERGRTPYMLAHEKEVRNAFRRFMASNPDKWDWHAAKVPSALTKEMEESQAAKQAEKDAKRKARAKELKKLRKAKEKKAQDKVGNFVRKHVVPIMGKVVVGAAVVCATTATALVVEAALPKNASKPVEKQVTPSTSTTGQSRPKSGLKLSKEEELQRVLAEEREKRAAAAERRIAALKIQSSSATTAPSISEPRSGIANDIHCSCCNSSLAGKVPFHRYNYKYCSTSCMHVHKEILEDE
ncbi:hypothetical protein TanjilG_24902 [Lupinus angustifolius]|uniref:VLRF1 domain-containing protein n=1 Tax=Lupinus angustifolius TaxID=3871 RepID=A0A4P1R029_LUPAN|nr:hypothetical protein TanjilG_24902 [Lupinus angustifolius]